MDLLNDRDMNIFRAVHYWGGEWPRHLDSGVLYFRGERITIFDFARVAQLIKPVLS